MGGFASRRAAAIATAVIVLAEVLAGAGVAPAEAAAGGRWTPVEATLPAHANATGYVDIGPVTCPTARFCVAVGAYFDATDKQQGFIETLSGGMGTAAPTPLPADASSGGSVLYDVTCPGPAACVAVGTYQPTSGDDGVLIDTLAAGRWTATSAPLPADADTTSLAGLRRVACSSARSCVGFGSYGNTSGDGETLVETLSGRTWTPSAAPFPANEVAGRYLDLSELTCATAGSCLAVGTYYVDTIGHLEGVIETRSGEPGAGSRHPSRPTPPGTWPAWSTRHVGRQGRVWRWVPISPPAATKA